MASSLLTGDRRWAPTRKSGMTVLGKVPKPINLPSQRLENHGLDPNVEIVPKGTHTWGSSRQSSAAPNAWGSSNLSSPNTDGSAGSPSHVNGRPSSGGSGTRPSTAGSDRSHEPASNAWGPNLRPSSASGILASNQISQTAGRPRSAETRPGSSQLSRFAENAVDTPVAWGATGTVERLGSFSSKTNSFTLSSGDFPTLGSEKSSDSQTQRGHSSQGRPASSSDATSAKKETLGPELAGNKNSDISVQGNVNTWRAENHPSLAHSAPPNVENWQKDPHQGQSYPHSDVPPHQFESWHNAPSHPSNGVWYRGGPAGGLYRPPGPPGNYPVEPYYPHVPARPLPNVQSFPRPEAGPAGYHPKNGDSYRPHMPLEAYMVPSHSAIPIRPGVFQGPVPYEGYYGPPHRGFSISSDCEGPVMGMAARPGVYNQYPTQNVNIDPGHFHGRPGGYSPVMNKEQMKSDNAYETQGQYRVLLKQHDSWEDHGQREKGEQAVISGSPHTEKGNQPVSTRDGDWQTDSTEGGNQPVSTRDGDWRTDSRKHEPAPLQPASGREGYSSDTIVRNSSQDSSKVAGDNMTRKSVTGTVQIRNIQQYPVTKKNATLMEKVEGLNSKARITDSHSETGIVSSKGKTKNFKDVSSSADRFGKVICATAALAESASSIGLVKPIPCEAIASTGDGSEVLSTDQNISSGPSQSQAYVLSKSKTVEAGENTHFQHKKRTSTRGVDHPAKLRSSRHDNDEWMKKSTARDSSANNIVKNGESKPETYVSEYHPSQEATDRQELHVAGSVVGGSYSASPLDSFDQKAQRAKIKEIAIQRAKQLQEEEEERTREQKAKALAKLEELNRRSLAESSNLKSNNVATPSNDILNKSEADAGSAPVADATLTEAPSSTLACDSEAARKKSDVGESAELPPHETAQASDSATQTFIVPQNQFMSMGQDKKTTEITEKMTDIHDIAGSRQKQMGYRRRQNTPQEKHLDEKQATLENTESPKYVGKVASNAPSSDTLPGSEDPSVQHRKKNNRGTRNRNKRDESMLSPSRSSAQTESTSEKRVIESGNTKPSETLAVAVSGPDERLNETGRTQVSKNAVAAPSRTTTNQEWSDSTEEIHGKASNHWKPHPHRKSNRGQQAHKPVTKHHGTEAVIWAPVRTANKNEPSEKVNQTSMSDTTNRSPGKVGHDMHNGVKAKRAEIERYVPKPVAKELSQGNSQQTLSLSQTASDDSGIPEPVSPRGGSGKSDALTVGKASFASDTKNGEGSKHNQYGRTQASWRQRGSAESLSPQNLVEGAFDTTKVVQKGSDQLQPSKIDSLQARQPDDWNGDNDSATPGESETIAVAKNEGTSRQRHHPYKTHRVAGGNYAAADNKNLQRGMANRIDTQPPVSSLKSENQNSSGDHIKSHWQPKPQTHTYYGRQGNRSSGGQRVGYSDKELPLPGPVNNMQNEDNSEPSQETVGGEARGADAAKRERKTIPDLSKEQTSSLNQDFPSTGESGRANFDPQQAQSYPSEVHRRGQYNDRFQRGQDAGRQTLEVNGDKRKNNQNLEYQPVGSYHKPSESQNPDAGEEAHKGPRYRERGRLNPRGGGGGRHFYGRSGGARVGDYHDGRE